VRVTTTLEVSLKKGEFEKEGEFEKICPKRGTSGSGVGGHLRTPPNSSENNLGKKILGLFLILTSNNHMSPKKIQNKNRAQSFGDAML
jgi:hypothetical protein